MKFTNKDVGPRYVHAATGLVIVKPGETSDDLDVSPEEAKEMRQARVINGTRHLWGIDEEGDGATDRVFLATAEDADGSGFRLLDIGNARFVGQFVGKTVSGDMDDWKFSPIRESYRDEDDGSDDDEGSERDTPSLTRQNLDQLKATAERDGVEIPENATKQGLINAINAKRKADAQ